MFRMFLAVLTSVALVVAGTAPAQASSVDAGCYDDAPYRVDHPYDGDDVVVCGVTPYGDWFVRNDSDTIWALTSPEVRIFELAIGTVRSHLFHESAKSFYRYIFLAPGDEVLIPSDAGGVEYAVQPDLAFMWIFYDQLVDKLEDKTHETVGDVVAGKSSRRAALWTCSLALWNAAREYDPTATWTDDPEAIWDYAVDRLEEGTACADAWAKARKTTAEVRFPTYKSIVLKVTQNGGALTDDAIVKLSATKSILANLGDLVCFLPKIRGIGC
ncbi:hypothetical protein JNB63_18765 [Microbacterium trichothecenolyticum]|uniref:hypothetical protein n=1 Tax=Microbacterium trichothecenolyticum TaxID=69370 RepID=UPI001C6F59A5|nr:hypothetical protein [Microbacterium trichothecenolyticum]MBW9122142.1 hypothetical protein [Microbacterium trichothecenolyticum]